MKRLGVILSLLSIIFIILFFTKQKESFDDTTGLVISHYNEDVQYLDTEPFSKYEQVIYTKGEDPPICKKCDKVIKLPNVGVCLQTYLHHIIENYDNLHKITIFLPGSCLDEHKNDKTINTITKVEETQTSVFYINQTDVQELREFKIDEYSTTNPKNKLKNNDSRVRLSDIRPFGQWHDAHFNNIEMSDKVNYGGIFAVSREHIRQRSLDSYKELITQINRDKNEETGHYFERALLSVFNHIPEECLYNA
jgi:hypothetical protein